MAIITHMNENEDQSQPDQTQLDLVGRESIVRLSRLLKTGLTRSDLERLDWYDSLGDYMEDEHTS